MALISTPVVVRTPATSANLGPGFDSFGLALARYDLVEARIAASGVVVEVAGEGFGELPGDGSHLVARAMAAAFERLGERPAGVLVRCRNEIPQARGLGSSSAAIVGGILAARALTVEGERRLDDAQVLALATELEGHPDNVAPCLLGGFTIAYMDGGVGRAVRLTPSPEVVPVVYVPAERGLTAHARAALPRDVPHADAAFNAGRAALLVHALTVDPDLLLSATEDRLHQPYRAAEMRQSADLVADLRSAGVPAVVSGAGPTVLALLRAGGSGTEAAPDAGPAWRTWRLRVDVTGASTAQGTIGHAERDPVAAGRES
jgi:homoserine kinase